MNAEGYFCRSVNRLFNVRTFLLIPIMRTTLDADVIEFLSTDEVEVGLARCLYSGKMPDRFIHQSDNIEDYNHLGVRSSKSYLESRLSKLLEKNIDNIAAQITFGSELVSLSLNKNGSERFLLQELSESKNVSYCVVSGSRNIIRATLSAVSDIVARKCGLVAFVEDLPLIQRYWRKPAVLCLLNNGFCVYEPDYLLALIHQAMGPDDIFCLIATFHPRAKWRY